MYPKCCGHVYIYYRMVYLDLLIHDHATLHAISWYFMLVPWVECAFSILQLDVGQEELEAQGRRVAIPALP